MADVKNFGLKGVAPDVQLGKRGPKLKNSSGTIQARNTADSAFVNLEALDPTTAQHVATKAYVDAATQNTDFKASVRAKTTANVTLAGGAPNTIDGVTLAANDRILVASQSTGSQNGLYFVATLGTGANGTWTRATDADTSAKVTANLFVFVEEGTAGADTSWLLTTNNPITLNTTALVFTQFGTGSFSQDPLYRQQAIVFSSGTINIGAVLPGTAKIQKVKVVITTAWDDAATTLVVDNTATTFMSAANNDLLELNSTFIEETLGAAAVGANTQLRAVLAGGSPTTGAATVFVEYTLG